MTALVAGNVGVIDIQPTMRLLDRTLDPLALDDAARSSPESPWAKMASGFEIPRERAAGCLAAAEDPSVRVTDLSPEEARFVSYLRELEAKAADVRTLVDTMVRGESEIVGGAEALAREYLPVRASFEGAEVVLVPMDRDAKISGRHVYFDPLLALALGVPGVIRLLGRELHHVARGAMATDGFTGFDAEVGSSFGKMLGLLLVLLEMDGIADRIAEITRLDPSPFGNVRAGRQAVFDGYAVHLEEVQTAVREAAAGTVSWDAAAGRVRGVATKLCHPIGFRMATEVESVLGRPRLWDCVADPVAFLDCYQEAAHDKGLFAFEDAVLADIKRCDAPDGRVRVR